MHPLNSKSTPKYPHLDPHGGLLRVQEDVLDGDPGPVVSPKEAHVHVLLRVDAHGLARPEREALQLGPDQKVGNALEKRVQLVCCIRLIDVY